MQVREHCGVGSAVTARLADVSHDLPALMPLCARSAIEVGCRGDGLGKGYVQHGAVSLAIIVRVSRVLVVPFNGRKDFVTDLHFSLLSPRQV